MTKRRRQQQITSSHCALCAMRLINWMTARLKQKKLANVKALLAAHSRSACLRDGISLEKGIIGALRKIADLNEKELFSAGLDPKELSQKVNPSENYILYNTVKNNVTAYFLKIRRVMTNLDRRGLIDYEGLQDQMKAIYKRLKKTIYLRWGFSGRSQKSYAALVCRTMCIARLLYATSFKVVRLFDAVAE